MMLLANSETVQIPGSSTGNDRACPSPPERGHPASRPERRLRAARPRACRPRAAPTPNLCASCRGGGRPTRPPPGPPCCCPKSPCCTLCATVYFKATSPSTPPVLPANLGPWVATRGEAPSLQGSSSVTSGFSGVSRGRRRAPSTNTAGLDRRWFEGGSTTIGADGSRRSRRRPTAGVSLATAATTAS